MVDLRAVALHDTVATVVNEFLRPRWPAAEASFNRCTHTAVANEVLLQQIPQNLLDNAAKYSRPGVIPKIEVWSESQGDVVRLTIADNGIGIARTDQERLFRIF